MQSSSGSSSSGVLCQGYAKRHGQGLMSTVSRVWLKLFSGHLEWSKTEDGNVENRLPLDHTATVSVKNSHRGESSTHLLHVQTGGTSGISMVFEFVDEETLNKWESSIATAVSKLKEEKKLRPSVVLFKKALRRNSYLSMSFDRLSSTSDIEIETENSQEVALFEGCLQKRGHVRQSWTNRYFVLTPNRLTYFEDSSMNVVKGFVTLNSYSYIQPRTHGNNATHRHLFSLHTSEDTSGPDENRHSLLMNGISDKEVGNWCAAISNMILKHKTAMHFRSVCVSTFLSEAQPLAKKLKEPMFGIKILDEGGAVLCQGHAYYADLRGINLAISSSELRLSHQFPRSHRRSNFGVQLSDEALENRRFQLELWLQDLVSNLAHEMAAAEYKNQFDSILADIGLHFNCSLKKMRCIFNNKGLESASVLSQLFGSTSTQEEELPEVQNMASKSVELSEEPNKVSEKGKSNDKLELPSTPAAMMKLDLVEMLQLCQSNNIDASSFRTRKEYVAALNKVYKASMPYLHDKNARDVVARICRSYSNSSDKANKQIENEIAVIFKDLLVKLEVVDECVSSLLASYCYKEQLKVIKKTVHVWDPSLSFTNEDSNCIDLLLNLNCDLDPSTLIVLRYRLFQAIHNPDWMYMFCARNGVVGIQMRLSELLEQKPLSNVSSVSIAELLKCARLLVESGGRKEITNSQSFILSVTNCLAYYDECAMATECLEFLTECIVYGGATALPKVVHGLDNLASLRNEKPFEVVVRMLAQGNVAMHCSVVGFVNSLVLYDKCLRSKMRTHSCVNMLGFEKICSILCSGVSNTAESTQKAVEDTISSHCCSAVSSTSPSNRDTEESSTESSSTELKSSSVQLRAGLQCDGEDCTEGWAVDNKTMICPNDGVMASYAQEIRRSSPIMSNSPGNVLAKQVRRMSLADSTRSEPNFQEETVWLHLSNLTLTSRTISKQPGSSTAVHVDQIVSILDYGDFDAPVPYSVQDCVTLLTADDKKYIYCFGEDIRTKHRWLVAFRMAISSRKFQKAFYSTHPSRPMASTAVHKYKKKFAKLFELYRSIRDEDALRVYHEEVVPTANSSDLLVDEASTFAPVDFCRYTHYEFQRRKDIKLNLLIKELAQYFVKNYAPKIPEEEEDSTQKTLHPAAVTSTKEIPKPPELPNVPPEKVVRQSSVKLRQIFWHKIKDVNVGSTIWTSVSEPEVDWTSLENKFGDKAPLRRNALVKKQSSTSDAGGQSNKKINLFDSRRSQNVAIACAKLRKSPKELYDIVIEMDPADLNLDVVDIVLNLLIPTDDELACLRAYTGNVEDLDFCGQLFSYFAVVEGLESRLFSQRIMLTWVDEAEFVIKMLKTMRSAIEEVNAESTMLPLKELLAVTLTVGNYMNGKSKWGKAHGFKLDTLLKLRDIKEKSLPQRNLLHFVMEQVHSTTDFYAQWDATWNCHKISKTVLEDLLYQLNESLETCVTTVNQAEAIEDTYIREQLVFRLGEFVDQSSVVFDEARESFETVDASVLSLKRSFGEVLMTNNLENSEDPWSSFFSTIVSFACMHRVAKKELLEFDRKLKAQKVREAKSSERKKLHSQKDNGVAIAVEGQPGEGRPRALSSPKRDRSNSGKKSHVDICEVFKERMIALNGEESSDTEDEGW